MEQLKLPFPSLQFLAAHAAGRCLVSMKPNYYYGNCQDTLRECELRVDKLPLPPAPREYVKNVLRGFFLQVQEWFRSCLWDLAVDRRADFLVDAHGNLDVRRMAQQHFQKRYKGQFFREDFQPFVRFLEYLSYYDPDCCSDAFVSIIVNLQKTNTSIVGPEYRSLYNDICVVFRFVNHRRLPPQLNALLKWKEFDRLKISRPKKQKDLLVTYRFYQAHHDVDMFRIHVDLLQPSKRLKFAKSKLYSKMERGLAQEVFHFLNVLDPEMRLNCLLCLNEDRFSEIAFRFLKSCLIPGYEALFIPMMEVVGWNLDSYGYFDLCVILVNQIDLIGFDGMLLQFWQLVPASKKSDFNDVSVYGRHGQLREALKNLSQTHPALFQIMFNDVSASLPQEESRHLLSVILSSLIFP